MSKVKGGKGKLPNSKKRDSIMELNPEEEVEKQPEVEDVSHITEEDLNKMQGSMASLASNPQIVSAVQKVNMACTRSQLGCTWNGKLYEFSAHFNEECDFIVDDCGLNCGVKLYRLKKLKHEETQCPNRTINCSRCKVDLLAKEKTPHEDTCPKFLLPCPNVCDPNLKICRDAIDQHRTECKSEIHECTFRQFGCLFKGFRKAIQKHMTDMAFEHFQMLHYMVTTTQEKIQQRLDDIEEEKEEALTFHGRLFNMENIYGPQCVWLITEFESKMLAAKNEENTTFYSPIFSIGRQGYNMMLSISPNGDGKAHGKFLSVYVSICRGQFDTLLKWPYNCPIKITLIDQCEDENTTRHIQHVIKPKVCADNLQFLGRPLGERNPGFGKMKFLDLILLETHEYVRDDTMVIKVNIDVTGTNLV